MGRAKLKTLKETTLVTFFEMLSMLKITNTFYNHNSTAGTITFRNGSQILLKDLFYYPSDPNFDELGSLEITGAFIDEANQIVVKARNIVKSRIRYKLDDFGILPKMLMTCNPDHGWVFTDFFKLYEEGKLPRHRKFLQSLHGDNPFLSEHYKENLKSLDKVTRQRLEFGNWHYSGDPADLMEYDKILDLFTNEYVDGGRKYITADIARFGRDNTVIGVWDGLRLDSVVSLSQKGVNSVAEKIDQLRRIHAVPLSNVIVDEDGVGGGVKDILKCKGFVNNSRPKIDKGKQNFDNLKSQCYFKLAEYVNGGKIFVSVNGDVRQRLIEDLEVVKQKDVDKDGKKGVLPKDKVKELIGRSPDYSDMMMMRMVYEIKRPSAAVEW